LFLLSDIITYIRRIVKTPSNTALSDNLIIDYINRFWVTDIDASMQLYDLKTKYTFQTTPGVDQYNMPLYSNQVEPGSQTISFYPKFQGFMDPAYVNGIQVPFYMDRNDFFKIWPTYTQQLNANVKGNGGASYSGTLPYFPALRGHVDITGVIAVGANPVVDPIVGTSVNASVLSTSVYPAVYITSIGSSNQPLSIYDSGQFLSSNQNYGLLTGTIDSSSAYSTTHNTINYATGVWNATFNDTVASTNNVNMQCQFFNQGIPRGVLFYNNIITIRPPPDISYQIDLTAYLSPAAFLSTSASVPFAYMSEYIARGAARKILSDTGDMEQFAFYEPLFQEQQMLVWKRSQRQFTSTRTATIFSSPSMQQPTTSTTGGV
jgi:hypothetical protein